MKVTLYLDTNLLRCEFIQIRIYTNMNLHKYKITPTGVKPRAHSSPC